MWISGKGKRGRVFVRFAKCTSQGNENEETLKSQKDERRIRVGEVVEEIVRNLG